MFLPCQVFPAVFCCSCPFVRSEYSSYSKKFLYNFSDIHTSKLHYVYSSIKRKTCFSIKNAKNHKKLLCEPNIFVLLDLQSLTPGWELPAIFILYKFSYSHNKERKIYCMFLSICAVLFFPYYEAPSHYKVLQPSFKPGHKKTFI